MFKRLLAILLLAAPWQAHGQGQAEQTSGVEISDGSRIELKDKGFSIVPPTGWEVHKEMPSLSFLFQVPQSKDLKYQRNITVRYGIGPRAIDDVTADEFEELIVENRGKLYSSVSNYRMRNRAEVETKSGVKGLLFYAQFQMQDQNMMEMHMLVSSDRGHFLMTFTDLAENFDPDASSPHWQEAYNSFISAEVVHPAPARFHFATTWGIVLLVLGILGFAARWAFGRTRGVSREVYAEADDDISSHSGVSSIQSDVSSIHSNVSHMPKAKKPKPESNVSGMSGFSNFGVSQLPKKAQKAESNVSGMSGFSNFDESQRPKTLPKVKNKKTRVENDDDMEYMPLTMEADDGHDDFEMEESGWGRSKKSKAKSKKVKAPRKKAVNQDFDDFEEDDDDSEFNFDD